MFSGLKSKLSMKNYGRILYDYKFRINAKQFESFKSNNFKGSYIVDWGKNHITTEVI